MNSLQILITIGFCGLIVAASGLIAFSKNLVHSAFALIGAFIGVAGLFAMLGADFVAIIQLLVYIGGITVLYLFAVLMTSGISDAKVTNASMATKVALPVMLVLIFILWRVIDKTPWFVADTLLVEPTTQGIGDALLQEYLLPFEIASILLLGTLVGAVALGRRQIEQDKKEPTP